MTPPAALRQEILRKVATTPQEAPARPRAASAPPRQAPAAPEPVPVTPTADGGAYAPSRQLPRLVLAACVAAVLACLGIATWQYQEAQDARATAERVQERAYGQDRLGSTSDRPATIPAHE